MCCSASESTDGAMLLTFFEALLTALDSLPSNEERAAHFASSA